MGAADRTVQHLRLRAPSAQAAVHAVHRLEDALRCASLPDAGERVLLVRRLHLGRLPEGLSSQRLSLLIEQRVAAAGGEWVNGGEERAAHSDTVFFEGRWQAASFALDRRARGLPLLAWYWRVALPDVALQGDPQAFVRGLWRCLEQEQAASAHQSALVADAVARGHGGWMARFLSHTLRSAGEAAQAEDGALVADGIHYCHPHRMDVPRDWPAALHAHLKAAGWRTNGRYVAGGQPGVQTCAASPPPHVSDETVGLPTQQPMGLAAAQSDTGEASRGELQTGATADAFARGEEAPAPTTSIGGLLFLLPVLSGLGFVEWQGRHPDLPLSATILRKALCHLRADEADPVWALVDSLPGSALPWPQSHQELATAWLDACRRHLYHAGRLSLVRVCWRPARLRWSATHLDVLLDVRHADIRVRRQGLDLDPGWLPWLGRVVTFNYQHMDALP